MSKNSNEEDLLYRNLKELVGEEIMVVTQASQLNLLGQTFRPIISGVVEEVYHGHITLDPAIIKMVNSPFYEFPTPLSIPLEKIAAFSTEVSSDTVFPIT